MLIMEYDDFNNEELPSAQSYRLQKIYEIEDEITQERDKRTALCTQYRRSIRIISVIDNALIVTVMGLSSSGLGVLTIVIAAPAIAIATGTGERTKTNPDKTPGQKPPRTIEIEFVQGTFVRDFCTRPTKMGGPRCVTYFRGGPEMCDKV